MHHAVADKLRIVQRRDHGEHALLLRKTQVRLEPDEIVDVSGRIVAPELNDSIGLAARRRVPQADGLQGAVAQRVLAAAGHDLDRHAALKDVFVLKAVHLRFLGGGQLPDEGLIFLARHGAVDVIRAPAVIAGGVPRLRHIDGLQRDERRSRVKEMQIIRLAEIAADGLAHGVGRQRARRDDDRPRRDLGHLLGDDRDIRVAADALRHHTGKAVAVDGKAAARLDACGVGALQDEAPEPPQLFLEQADGIFQPVAAQGVGADKLRKIRAVVRRGHFYRLHLGQADAKAALGKLPCGLTARKSRADHAYFGHASLSVFVFLRAAGFFSAAFFVVFAVFAALAALAALAVFPVFVVLAVLAGFFSASSAAGAISSAFSTVSVVAFGMRRL